MAVQRVRDLAVDERVARLKDGLRDADLGLVAPASDFILPKELIRSCIAPPKVRSLSWTSVPIVDLYPMHVPAYELDDRGLGVGAGVGADGEDLAAEGVEPRQECEEDGLADIAHVHGWHASGGENR